MLWIFNNTLSGIRSTIQNKFLGGLTTYITCILHTYIHRTHHKKVSKVLFRWYARHILPLTHWELDVPAEPGASCAWLRPSDITHHSSIPANLCPSPTFTATYLSHIWKKVCSPGNSSAFWSRHPCLSEATTSGSILFRAYQMEGVKEQHRLP